MPEQIPRETEGGAEGFVEVGIHFLGRSGFSIGVRVPDDAGAIKASEKLILEVFGLEKTKGAHPCPCGSSDALSLYHKEDRWKFKCHSCGKQGSVIDALMLFKGMEQAAAFEECRKRLGIERTPNTAIASEDEFDDLAPVQVIQKKQKDPERGGNDQDFPALDEAVSERLISTAHKALLNSEGLRQKWMENKRAISLDVVKRYRLGWLTDYSGSGWVLPITNHDGKLLAIKRHLEITIPQPSDKPDKKPSKSRWITNASTNGQNAIKTFWPHPYSQQPVSSDVFNSDPSFWVSKLSTNSQIFSDWNLKLGNIQYSLALETEPRITPDEFSASQYEFCFKQAWDEMAEDIQAAVLKTNPNIGSEFESSVDDWMILCPGELKALSLISAGARATSWTHGENSKILVEDLRCFRGRRVAIFYDDDLPKERGGKIEVTGRNWALHLIPRLEAAGALEVRAFTGGRQ